MRKKAVFTLKNAHGVEQDKPTVPSPDSLGQAAAWVQSVACSWGTDLAASGAGDGALKLWEVCKPIHALITPFCEPTNSSL